VVSTESVFKQACGGVVLWIWSCTDHASLYFGYHKSMVLWFLLCFQQYCLPLWVVRFSVPAGLCASAVTPWQWSSHAHPGKSWVYLQKKTIHLFSFTTDVLNDSYMFCKCECSVQKKKNKIFFISLNKNPNDCIAYINPCLRQRIYVVKNICEGASNM